jgi:hypothetical protein
MTNVSSFEGLIASILIFICTCTLFRRVKAMKSLTNEWNYGPLSLLHKASVIGLRLKLPVAIACVAVGTYVLLLS